MALTSRSVYCISYESIFIWCKHWRRDDATGCSTIAGDNGGACPSRDQHHAPPSCRPPPKISSYYSTSLAQFQATFLPVHDQFNNLRFTSQFFCKCNLPACQPRCCARSFWSSDRCLFPEHRRTLAKHRCQS